MIKTPFYIISFAVSIGLLLSSFYFLYLVLKPFTPPTVTPYPIPILNENKTVHYGEAIQTKVTSCTFDEIPITASVKYQNSEGQFFLFSSHDSIGKKGCKESVQNREPVPSTLPPGIYTISVIAVFHVSPFKNVTKVYETERFTLEATPSGELKKKGGL